MLFTLLGSSDWLRRLLTVGRFRWPGCRGCMPRAARPWETRISSTQGQV